MVFIKLWLLLLYVTTVSTQIYPSYENAIQKIVCRELNINNECDIKLQPVDPYPRVAHIAFVLTLKSKISFFSLTHSTTWLNHTMFHRIKYIYPDIQFMSHEYSIDYENKRRNDSLNFLFNNMTTEISEMTIKIFFNEDDIIVSSSFIPINKTSIWELRENMKDVFQKSLIVALKKKYNGY